MSTDTLPPPPVPADCDLRNFQDMPLEVDTLRDSDLRRRSTGDEFKAAVILWAACWHQMPSGSLPDDDVELADLAGIGTGKPAVRAWQKVKPMALRGWYKASDGRLYHPVMSRKAVEKWGVKLATKRKREQDADRLRTWRETHPETHVKRVSAQRAHGESRVESSMSRVESSMSRGESIPAAAAAVVDAPPSEPGLFDQPAAQAPAPAMLRSWMDWRLTIGRHRVYLDREGNAEAHWAELFNRAGWDEFSKAWDYCAARTTKPDGKVFLSNLLEVIQ